VCDRRGEKYYCTLLDTGILNSIITEKGAATYVSHRKQLKKTTQIKLRTPIPFPICGEELWPDRDLIFKGKLTNPITNQQVKLNCTCIIVSHIPKFPEVEMILGLPALQQYYINPLDYIS